MPELQIDLKGREPIVVNCDKYEELDLVEGSFMEQYLVLYRGERQIGKYRKKEITGYHERS